MSQIDKTMQLRETGSNEACSEGCPGWCVIDNDGVQEIQRCDACGRFESDADACAEVSREAEALIGIAQESGLPLTDQSRFVAFLSQFFHLR